MLKLAETVECSNLFRLTLAHLQWLSRRLLLVEGSAQKSLKLSPRVSFPPRLAHLDQFKPIFETWLTTPAGTSIWMAEPPLSAPAPPCQHNKFQISERPRGFHEEETSWTAGLMFGEEIGGRINIQIARIWPESLITRRQHNATAAN